MAPEVDQLPLTKAARATLELADSCGLRPHIRPSGPGDYTLRADDGRDRLGQAGRSVRHHRRPKRPGPARSPGPRQLGEAPCGRPETVSPITECDCPPSYGCA
jgi:hypothetical protein